MASTHETTKTNNKTELSATQLKTVVKATSMSEDEVRQTYGQSIKKILLSEYSFY